MTLVHKLITKNAFVYHVYPHHNNCIMLTFTQDPTACTGLFETLCIAHILGVQWFADPYDEGVSFHIYFNPIPLPTIMLVLIAVWTQCHGNPQVLRRLHSHTG